MSFTANSSDGASHHVQVYSDVSGGASDLSPKIVILLSFVTEWISGDRTQQILWSPTVNDRVIFHKVELQQPENFTEMLDRAEWGALYYAMENVSR